jgi:hypothetical protein
MMEGKGLVSTFISARLIPAYLRQLPLGFNDENTYRQLLQVIRKERPHLVASFYSGLNCGKINRLFTVLRLEEEARERQAERTRLLARGVEILGRSLARELHRYTALY